MEKYFTPEETDFRVGMEYETEEDELRGIWEKHIVENLYDLETISRFNQKYIGKYANIRIQYLTKEQIEAEGCEYLGNTKLESETDQWNNLIFKKRKTNYNENVYIIYDVINNKLLVFYKEEELTSEDILYNGRRQLDVIYFGICKDINTFRYICKLIGI